MNSDDLGKALQEIVELCDDRLSDIAGWKGDTDQLTKYLKVCSIKTFEIDTSTADCHSHHF